MEPLLLKNDVLKHQAEKKIQLIYKVLNSNLSKIPHLGIYSGKMGICLFLYYYEKLYEKRTLAKRILYDIHHSLSEMNDGYNFLDFSEFGWMLQHLKNNQLISIDIDEVIMAIDDALEYKMIHLFESNMFELLYGATNIALYFYGRKREIQKHAIDLYIEVLHKKAVVINEDNLTWSSPIDLRKNLDKHIDLGIAHGVPAIILFLTKLKKSGFENPYLDELIVKSCNFILSITQDPKIYLSHFDYSVNLENRTNSISRLAWCYGDLSIGYALLQASKYYSIIEDKVNEILVDTTKRTDNAFVFDDCLCHGSFGNAHIYNRIYSQTKNNVFKETALYWYEKGLSSKNRSNCAAGIGFFTGDGHYKSNYCLLDGIAGIGLALISAISDIEPKWDECLLLS